MEGEIFLIPLIATIIIVISAGELFNRDIAIQHRTRKLLLIFLGLFLVVNIITKDKLSDSEQKRKKDEIIKSC